MQHCYLQYRNNSIISYIQSDRYQVKKDNSLVFRDTTGARIKTYTGTITKGSKKRLTKAVSLLIQSTPTRTVYNQWLQRQQRFKINFITLTISDNTKNITAKDAHGQLLEPMLLWLRRKQQMKSYVWKAELQERGQIHYHITADCYVDLKELRQAWNNLQEKAGLLDNFATQYGHRNPNSTDIHSVKKVRNLEAYLIKYISKTDEDRGSTEGKVWDCSTNLKKAQYYTTLYSSETGDFISTGIEKGYIRPFYNTNFSIFSLTKGTIYETLTDYDKSLYKAHILAIRHG